MEEITQGQVPAAIESQETTESVETVDTELVPVDTLRRASREAKEFRQKLQSERAKLAEREAELHAIKQAQLEQQGKYKEMYEAQTLQAKKFQEEYEALQKKVVYEKVSSAVKMEAKDAGCVDPNAFLKLTSLDSLEVDDNLQVSKESLLDIISKGKEKLPYMFQKNAPVIADTAPGSVQAAAPKSVSEMNQKELKEYMDKHAEALKKKFASQGF